MLVAILLAGCGAQEVTEPQAGQQNAGPVRWKLAGTFPSSLIMLGSMGKRIETQAARISGGNLQLKYYEPGALVPALEVFDAVSFGALEAGWSTPGYWAGKVPALQIFGSIPFGPDASEYLGWYYFGGGKPLFEEIYAKHNIHGIICGMSPPEASGWFKRKVDGLADLPGLKMRFFGLGARVMEKVGVSTQLLAGGDIFPALELGTIDATEFSMPAVDYEIGFYQVASYYYFPGWHQQSTFFELLINKDAWQRLSASQQAQIDSVCGDNVRFGIAQGEALQFKALEKLRAKNVNIERWSPEVLEALETAWTEVAEEEAAKDEDFNRAWTSLKTFRQNYAQWRELGYLD